MSVIEVKPLKSLRKLAEIEREYWGLAQRTGHLQYQIHVLSKDLNLLNKTLEDLNLEAAKAKEAEVSIPNPPESEKSNA